VKVGDLVRSLELYGFHTFAGRLGIIVDFHIRYNKFGDPTEKFAVVNWGSDYPDEKEYMESIEVISESR